MGFVEEEEWKIKSAAHHDLDRDDSAWDTGPYSAVFLYAYLFDCFSRYSTSVSILIEYLKAL